MLLHFKTTFTTLSVCLCGCCTLIAKVCEKKPSGIRKSIDGPTTALDESQHSQQALEGIESRSLRQGISKSVQKSIHHSVFLPDFKGRGSHLLSYKNGAMRVSFPLSGTGAIWQRLSLESCHCLEVGRDKKQKKVSTHIHTHTHLADRVVLCWLGSPHCDLNLFCLEYECPVGSWCTSRVQTDSMCEHYVHGGLSICGRETEEEWDGKKWRVNSEARKQGKSSCVCVCVSCDSQVSCGHVHRFK